MAETAWEVTSQRQTSVSNGDTYVPAIIVTFKVADNVFGSVTVPESEYNVKMVREMIQTKANEIEAVGALKVGKIPGS